MSTGASRYRLFIAVSPGLEALLAAELAHLGVMGEAMAGGVECTGTLETLWGIHHHSRLAESVRLRLRPFEARTFAQLEHGLRRLPWHAYLRRDEPFEIAVTCQKSRLYHSDAIAERVQCIVSELRGVPSAATNGPHPLQAPPDSAGPAQKLHVRVVENVVQVSINASGERLHRRGYRTHVGAAPLRETLAAATVRLLAPMSNQIPISRVWDPCCGSGTLLGEWLLLQQGVSQHLQRHFAFESWPIHTPAPYLDWLRQQPEPISLPAECQAFGSDIDSRSISACRANLERAKVLSHCTLYTKDFRDAAASIPSDTAVVSNLPYGVRLQDRAESADTFLALDRLLRDRADLRPVVVLNTLPPPAKAQCGWQRLAEFANGGLRVGAWGVK
jgi:putative N6-adenine-specific DNA methylase